MNTELTAGLKKGINICRAIIISPSFLYIYSPVSVGSSSLRNLDLNPFTIDWQSKTRLTLAGMYLRLLSYKIRHPNNPNYNASIIRLIVIARVFNEAQVSQIISKSIWK